MTQKLPVIGHSRLVNALKKAGFETVREGKHIIMRKDNQFLSIPRHNPLKRFTIEGIVKDAGLTFDEFIKLL